MVVFLFYFSWQVCEANVTRSFVRDDGRCIEFKGSGCSCDFSYSFDSYPLKEYYNKKMFLDDRKKFFDSLNLGKESSGKPIFHLRFADVTRDYRDDSLKLVKDGFQYQRAFLFWSPTILLDRINEKGKKISDNFSFGLRNLGKDSCYFELEDEKGNILIAPCEGNVFYEGDLSFVDFDTNARKFRFVSGYNERGKIVNSVKCFKFKDGKKFKLRFYLGSFYEAGDEFKKNSKLVYETKIKAEKVPFTDDLLAIDYTEGVAFSGKRGKNLISSFAHPKKYPSSYYSKFIGKTTHESATEPRTIRRGALLNGKDGNVLKIHLNSSLCDHKKGPMELGRVWIDTKHGNY